MKKVFILAVAAGLLVSMLWVPASASGGIALVEAWFEDAVGERIYKSEDVSAVPYMYVDNTSSEEKTVTFIAATKTGDKLADVTVSSVTVPAGESKISNGEFISLNEGSKTSIMLWDSTNLQPLMTPVVTFDEKSKNAEILSLKIGDAEGKITNEVRNVTKTVEGSTTVLTTNYLYEKSITVNLPDGTDLTALAPVIEVAEGAAVSPASGTSVDFSGGPVEYTVTAEDGTTAVYTVYVDTFIKVYGETVGSSFATQSADDLDYKYMIMPEDFTFGSGSVSTETSPESGSYLISGSRAGYLRADKGNWGSSTPLYYTRADVAAGKHIVRDGETLSVYYPDISSTEPVAEGSEADTDICYVLMSDDRKVMNNQLSVSSDPADTSNGNLCLKYDKRFPSGVSSATSYRFIQNLFVPPLDKYAGKNILKTSYDFDLYVPENGSSNSDIQLGFGHSASTIPTYRVNIDTDGKDVLLYFKSAEGTDTPAAVVARIKNGCDRWAHITIDVDYTPTGDALDNIKFYVDGRLAGKANYTTYSTFAKIYGFNSPRYAWSVTATHSGAKGFVYFDNIEVHSKLAS